MGAWETLCRKKAFNFLMGVGPSGLGGLNSALQGGENLYFLGNGLDRGIPPAIADRSSTICLSLMADSPPFRSRSQSQNPHHVVTTSFL